MNKEKLDDIISNLAVNVANNDLREALDLLSKLVENTYSGEYMDRFNGLKENYHLILKYFAQGVKDPERPALVRRLKRNIFLLADDVKVYIYRRSAEIPNVQFKLDYEEFLHYDLKTLKLKIKEMLSLGQETDERAHLRNAFFYRFWLTNSYTETEINLLKLITKSEDFSWYEKSLFVSAITLSLLQYFNVPKFNALIEFVDKEEEQVWERALVGLALALYRYDKRITIFTDLYNRLRSWENPKVASALEKITIQIIRTQETEKITKKLNEEILPEITKLSPKIVEDLDLDNILGDDSTDDINPDWESIFSDSPDLLDRVGELSMMQMEGSDVFMSTFSALKNFDFFYDLPNWFLPFYKENKSVQKAISVFNDDVAAGNFIESLSKMPIMCNSDKYSFCFNLINMPAQQLKMMSSMVMSEFEQINELSEGENLTNPEEKSRYIFTQYTQDLYRFFKLSPNRNLFRDIFTDKLKFYDKKFFALLTGGKEILYRIAQFYFEKEDFEKSAEVFGRLIAQGENSLEIYQKLGFAYQKQRKYREALDYYLKAELFEHENIWTMRKIAFCYLKLKKTKKALKYYTLLQDLEPDNLLIQVQLGRCNLEMKKYDEALKHYFKVEYLQPKNTKVWKPIAWCCLALGKFEKSEHYLLKILDNKPGKHDFMNLGHVYLMQNNTEKAIEMYQKSINRHDNDYDAFLEEMEYDYKVVLKKFKIDKYQIKLIEDYLYFEEEEFE